MGAARVTTAATPSAPPAYISAVVPPMLDPMTPACPSPRSFNNPWAASRSSTWRVHVMHSNSPEDSPAPVKSNRSTVNPARLRESPRCMSLRLSLLDSMP